MYEKAVGHFPNDGTKFYWRVRGYNSRGDGPWSTPIEFTSFDGSVPGQPTAFYPAGTVFADVIFGWSAVAKADYYCLVVTRAAGGVAFESCDHTLVATGTSIVGPFNGDGTTFPFGNVYVCTTKIRSNAPPGLYSLRAERVTVTDSHGARIAVSTVTEGTIVVEEPNATQGTDQLSNIFVSSIFAGCAKPASAQDGWRK